jgi:3-phosphoshikimate 1-carboxyvinyltransferase
MALPSMERERSGVEPVNSHGDHRLAMSMAIAGLAAQKSVTIENAEIMKRSFP